jgi:predicted permease
MMRLLAELRDDLAYAVRTLRREPMLVVGVVVSVGLSIGANAAMVGLARRLLADAPPGVGDPASVRRLALHFRALDGREVEMTTTSNPVAVAMGSLRAQFAYVAAVTRDTLVVGRGAELEEVSAVAASGDYFHALAARPLRGRFFDEADAQLPTGSSVVVLGHRFWQRRFGGDAGVLGGELLLDGEPYTVIGVAAPDFSGDDQAPADVFVPLPAALRTRPGWWSDARINLVSVIARLRNGTTIAEAERAAAVGARQALAGDPRADELGAVVLRPLLRGRDARETPQGKVTVWLSAVSAVVLFLATANVATLLLLRTLRRRREIAVRIALGISRPRLARQLLTESLVLALLGGGLGLLLATWLAELVRATLLPGLAVAERAWDAPLLGATLAAVLGVGVLAGMAPLVQLRGRDIVANLKGGAVRVGAGRPAFPRLLVVLQVVLCTVLAVGAGLFLRSLQRVRAQDLGFSTADLLYVRLDPRVSMPGGEQDRLHRDAVERLTMVPGVVEATVADATPFGSFHVPPISVPGLDEAPNVGGQLPMMYGATPAYLRMMRVSLRDGRLFDERDGRTAPLVVLVNESMARTVWPGERAVGKCIRVGFDPAQPPGPLAPATLPCREVVGVVRDSRVRLLRATGEEARLMQYYVPFEQLPPHLHPDVPTVQAILVQTAGDPAAIAGRVQRLIQSTAPVPVVARVRPYDDLLAPQLRPWRQGATLFGALAMLALGIAGVGAFAVVSYLVAQQRREIGVRLALGGTGRRIARDVVAGAVATVAIGATAGLAIALAAGRLVEPLLFETSPRDVVVLAGATVAVLALAVAAALGPAARAARTSPLVALRAGDEG